MLDLGGENNFAGLLIDNCNACYLRSGIDFDLQLRRRRIDDLSLENDREGVTTKDGGLALFQKQPGAARRRWR